MNDVVTYTVHTHVFKSIPVATSKKLHAIIYFYKLLMMTVLYQCKSQMHSIEKTTGTINTNYINLTTKQQEIN